MRLEITVLEKNKKSKSSQNQDNHQTLIFCYGLLSNNIHLQRLSPSIPPAMRFVKQVGLGESHCVLLLGDGTLWGVGSNEFGQLGFPNDPKIHESLTVEELRQIPLIGFNLQKESLLKGPKQEITQLACGKNHTVIVIEEKTFNKMKLHTVKKICSFGIEVGVGVEGVEGSTH